MNQPHHSQMIRRIAPILITLALCPMPAVADSIWTSQGANSPAIELQQIHIVRMDANELTFVGVSGQESRKPLAQVRRLAMDDEPDLSAAEQAFATGKWDAATDGYLKTLRTTSKPWLKGWCGLRLINASTRANRFEATLTGYLTLVSADPATAANNTPKLPEAGSTLLEDAVTQLSSASQDRSLNDTQRAMILRLLLEVHKRRNDTEKATAIAQDLARLNPTDTGNLAVMADLRLSQAQVSLRAGDFDHAISQIQSSRAVFVQPRQQADALFLIAQATEAKAIAALKSVPIGNMGPDQTKHADPQAMKQAIDQVREAEIAYLRVVAYFPQDSQAGPALLATARLYEILGENQTALDLYRQAAGDYPSAQADQQVRRMEEFLARQGH